MVINHGKKTLEKYSSAISLSDMEIFVFPELMYGLVLANIMSPEIWKWREIDTFRKLEGKSPYRRLMRMRQFIMDEYEFNLDLNTWGLTDKDVELGRFADIIPPEKIAQSNALFGYQGDEYYFDIGIRRHFGLDKYNGNLIPYWKTETVEAMNAFRYRDGYTTGAGECVSLAALYMAAAYIVCDIPLEDMYMILTPLHSQNYIDINDGSITNNRRVVTKAMWFNGTEITAKAQRALRNENVTIVAHNTGHIHCIYDTATIDPQVYDKFCDKITEFLRTELDMTVFANFLRNNWDYRKSFVFCRHVRDEHKYVKAETLFSYEHNSTYNIDNSTLDKLLAEVDGEDFYLDRPQERICIEQFMKFVRKMKIDLDDDESSEKLALYLGEKMDNSADFVKDLREFTRFEPVLPDKNKKYVSESSVDIRVGMSREEIIDYLRTIRKDNRLADLAFYAYREADGWDWEPFIKASIERCPVSVEKCRKMELEQVYEMLTGMENKSIYCCKRLAHPDEVINYSRGDGIEKAFTLANIIRSRTPETALSVDIDGESVTLSADEEEFEFYSTKNITDRVEF
jgi:hypothetical protein